MPVTYPPGGGDEEVPTGTGFRHITSDVEDSAAKLVENADVHAAAAIAQSKIANLTTDLSDLASDIASHTHNGLAPTGGTTGQVLKKVSNTNYDYGWDDDETAAPGGGVTMDEVIDALYPVGSIYISTLATNPGTLLGRGTWAAFGAGRVLVGLDAGGDTAFDTIEETGGAKTVTSTGSVAAPTFTGDALGTHSHGAGTYAPSAHAGTAVADHASHTHTYSEIVNHTHAVNITDNGHTHTQASQTATTGAVSSWEHGAIDTSSTAAETLNTGSSTTGITATTSNPAGSVATGTTNGPSATLTHSVTQPDAHTMSGSSQAVSAGTPSGTNSAPAYTGNATSVLQPYIVVTMWKRTA